MRPVVAPIAIDYLSTSLRNHGYEVEFLDLAFARDRLRCIEERLNETEPLAIGITVRNTDDCYLGSRDFFLPEIRQLAGFVKERTSAPVILGGCGFSIMPTAILEYCGCDVGIRGDGETSFLQFLNALKNDTGYTSVPGLVYRARKRWRMNSAANMPLQEFSYQKRDVVNNPRYLAEGGMGNIETKRGCDRRYGFATHGRWWTRLRRCWTKE
jgi:radical SAM superfamily enzyme YgiQ (UPF0313 family)